MRYVSEEEIIRLRNLPNQDVDSRNTLKWLLDNHCKELPEQQWQTREEFKANPVEGWCWIQHKTLKITMSHYRRIFTVDGEMFADEYITHVMPIKTPEAPK